MQLLKKYFPELSKEQIELFTEMEKLYRFWNEKVNLISRKDIDFLEEHHFLHSLAIAKAFIFPDKSTVLDVGTGGGFPGIPLAVYFPNVQFTLMDSIGKKVNVVKEVAQALNLQNVTPIKARSNEYKEQKFDFIVSRAVTTLPKFYTETKHLINKNSKFKDFGIFYLKGGDFFDELKPFHNTQLFALKDYFIEDYFYQKFVVHIEPNKR